MSKKHAALVYTLIALMAVGAVVGWWVVYRAWVAFGHVFVG